MRRFWMFLAAVGLGSVTVIGQDDDNDNRALRERIAQLTRELQARKAQKQAPERLRVVLRSYEVGDLCSPVLDEILEPTNLHASNVSAPEREVAEPPGKYEIDMVIEMIRMLVSPESWDVVERADVHPKGTRLFITNLPAVHKRIPVLLNHLRSFLDAQVAVEVVAVPVDATTAAVLRKRPRELGADEAQKLLGGETLGSARVVCFDGQQVVHKSGVKHSYVADYDPKIAQGAAIGDPIRAEVFAGCAIEIRASLDRRGGGAVLHCQLQRTALDQPVRKLATEHGPVELPVLQLTRVQTSLWAPLGKTVVAGGGTAGGQPCVFLVTARKVRAGG